MLPHPDRNKSKVVVSSLDTTENCHSKTTRPRALYWRWIRAVISQIEGLKVSSEVVLKGNCRDISLSVGYAEI